MENQNIRKRQLRFATAIRVRKYRRLNRARRYPVDSSSENSSLENIEVDRRHLNLGDVDARNNTIDPAGIIDENLNVNDGINSTDHMSSSTNEDAVEENHISSESAAPTDADTSNTLDDLPEELGDASSISSSVSSRLTGTTSITVSSIWSDERMDSEISDVVMFPEIEQLRVWALESQIEQNHLDALLKILRRRLLPDLPKSSKTFLKTSSAKYNIVEMEDSKGDIGEFVYFGLRKNLERCVDVHVHTSDVIELVADVDGMPITHSGLKQMWVTACKIHHNFDIYQPFPVAVFYGRSKPASAEIYLQHFIDELNQLLLNGIVISERHYNVSFKCFVCDTPARAFLKCTVGHVAKYACERCNVEGTKRNLKSTVYPSTNAQKRTDESFRGMHQPEHHHEPTPLLRIEPGINIISSFVLDIMHLCFLGVMKKLIEWWLTGEITVRLGRRMKEELSKRIEELKQHVPSEFQRKTRSILHWAKWKATEFRFFLLYCGPVVMKNILSKRLYKHFLLLHVALRILCCERFCHEFRDNAKTYLRIFFESLPGFYGRGSQILNLHHLIHLADDVRDMRCSLSKLTAFPFENMLGKMKGKLRTATRPLAQLCRRLFEEYAIKPRKASIPPKIEILKFGGLEDYREIKYKQIILSTKTPDNIVILNNKDIFKIERMFGSPRSISVEGRIWKKEKSIFTYPFPSDQIDMWELRSQPSVNTKILSIDLIDRKMVFLPMAVKMNERKRFYVMPLLH